jgi:hypothetical protein
MSANVAFQSTMFKSPISIVIIELLTNFIYFFWLLLARLASSNENVSWLLKCCWRSEKAQKSTKPTVSASVGNEARLSSLNLFNWFNSSLLSVKETDCSQQQVGLEIEPESGQSAAQSSQNRKLEENESSMLYFKMATSTLVYLIFALVLGFTLSLDTFKLTMNCQENFFKNGLKYVTN